MLYVITSEFDGIFKKKKAESNSKCEILELLRNVTLDEFSLYY